jgi:2,3-bisphosphoglycerate-dependent phosphoglycerate mutase
MIKIVLLRHGESTWNKKGLFTGWTDVPLTPLGVQEARRAGQELKERGFVFDLAFTSLLRRAKKTLDLVLRELKQTDIPVKADWRLNERHYGNLQGLSKQMMVERFGEKQVLVWRRSYDIRPPKINPGNRYNQKGQVKYREIKVPGCESLKDVVARVVPFWKSVVVPLLKKKKSLLISASGNSLRAIIKHLDKVKPREIIDLNIPYGIPLVYELDDRLKPIRHYYLADQATVRAVIDKIKNQGKKKPV